MRESRTYGSVRGARGNPRPYRYRLRNPGPLPDAFPDCAIGRRFAPRAGSIRATK